MLKTVSSITNAIGALNFKGTWNASTNTPTIVSGVGVKGDYFVVSVAGSTAIDGISNWGIGDWITYNGSVWQRVEGGADLNGVNLSVSGTSTLSNLTASTALALNASKEIVSVTNTGTGNNVLATTPTFASTIGVGNAAPSVSGAGVTFPASQSASTDANTLDDYEEGTFTSTLTNISNLPDLAVGSKALYTKVGNVVTINLHLGCTSVGAAAEFTFSLPFALKTNSLGVSLTAFGFPYGVKWFGSATSTTAIRTFADTTSGAAQDINIAFSYITS